jgi:hypothetical protein
MKRLAALVAFALIFGLFPLVLAFGDRDGQATSPEWRVLEHTVQEVLTGGRLGPYSARIAPGAQLAFGDSVLDLGAALAGDRAHLLAWDQTKPPTVIRERMSRDGDAAFMLFGTRHDSEMRYHTVVFMQDSTGTWAIESWHVSP